MRPLANDASRFQIFSSPKNALKNADGVALIEIVIGTIMISTILVSLSIGFPKLAADNFKNRERLIAHSLATSAIETIKGASYGYIDPTISSDPSFNSCDCTRINYSVLTSTTQVIDGIPYVTTTCINFVAPTGSGVSTTWVALCSPDSGYKQLVAHVMWANGSQNLSLNQVSLVSRAN